MKGLTTLSIGGNGISDAGAREIATNLKGLTTLDISDNRIGDEGAREIATNLKGLTTLKISYNWTGYEGAREIANHLKNLTTLNIRGNEIGYRGAREIANHLNSLSTLCIGVNQIGDEGAREIANNLGGLTTLDISDNGIGDEGAREIANHLKGLMTLNISDNRIGDAQTIIDMIKQLCPGGNPVGGWKNKFVDGNPWAIVLRRRREWRSIFVDGNPLTFSLPSGSKRGIPIEALYISDSEMLLARLLEFRPDSGVEQEPIFSIRMSVVGKKQVGKSHLWQQIEASGMAVGTPEKTRAWELRTVGLDGMGPNNQAVLARFFDLGGDLELHGGHKTFFGDKRCIYLIVVNASEPRSESLLDYWLRIVRCYGWYEDQKKNDAPQFAPSIVVLSHRDRGVHEDFTEGVLLNDAVQGDPELSTQIVRDYWDPRGTTGRGARSEMAKKELARLDYETQYEVLRGAIERAVQALHPEINYSYPAGYRQVMEQCEAEDGPLSKGPITRAELSALFFNVTGNENDKKDSLGLDLLRNLGVVICPQRDKELAAEKKEMARQRGLNLLMPRETVEARDRLGDLVFGVSWLRGVMYRVVSATTDTEPGIVPFKHDKGVVTRQSMMDQLTVLVGGDTNVADAVLNFLKTSRLVFDFVTNDDSEAKYLVVDRIPESVEAEPGSSVYYQNQVFKDGSVSVMKLKLLLATHLPQFIGLAYEPLQRDRLGLADSVFRDRVVVCDGDVQILVRVDLNAGEIHATAIGGDAGQQKDLLARIKQKLFEVTGERSEFEPVDGGEVGPKTWSAVPAARGLPDSRRKAWCACDEYIKKHPEPTWNSRRALFLILKGDREYRDDLPDEYESFARYLREAKKHLGEPGLSDNDGPRSAESY